MTRAARAALALVLLPAWGSAVSGCAGWGSAGSGSDREPPAPYRPDRRDYSAFRDSHPELLEPNYLPFMVHRMAGTTPLVGDDLVFCRWPAERMPLGVYIEEGVIPEALQNEFSPVKSDVFTAAVAAALALAGLAAGVAPAQAFCGFYVAKADAKLFNEASKVVIARHDGKTVITMVNDYIGDPRET